MPVEDHPTHESTKKSGRQPGCWDRPPLQHGFWAQDGWIMLNGVIGHSPNWVWVRHSMTTKCQSDFAHCAGCSEYREP